MKYEVIDLFGTQQSNGTFDDIFSTEKYANLKEAYAANDYVKCDYVKDEEGIIHIEIKNVKRPEQKLYWRLLIQNPFAGIDVLDDKQAVSFALKLI